MKKVEIKRGDKITINGMPEGYEVVRVGFARQGELYLGSGDANFRVIVREIEEPKPLVIEAGKWYWLRNWVIAGPIEPHKKVKGYWSWGELVWREDGSSTRSRHLDFVEEAPNAEPPKPTYIPWTYETCPIGVVVEKKGEKLKAMIHAVFANGATVHGSVKYFSVLLDEWEQLDGTPCGVEVSE
jgi:hypothetical protein